MAEKLQEKDSVALYFVRAMAILASVAAHVSVIDKSTALSTVCTCLWDMFSCVSVGSFLIIAGILYTRTPGDSWDFWKRKGKSMILPWLFCGMLTYGYRALYEPSSLLGLVCWILGHGSWLYYVTIHLLMLALFKPIHRSVPALWACVAVTAVQLAMKANGGGIPSPLDNDYLNPLHWMGFFALGVLLRRNGLRLGKRFLAGCVLVFAVSAVTVYRRSIFSYFHLLNAVYSVSFFFVLFALGRLLAGTKLRGLIREVGASTYCIYLLHMQIVLPVLRRIPFETLKTVLSPVIGLVIMMVLIEIGKAISRKLPFGDKLRMLVGLR